MRSINIHRKSKVVKLFLQGSSYDDIVGQTGVSKGAVVNIINDFREGRLRLPPDMAGYVDVLRQVAVDLRKNSATVGQLKSYLKIHAKLKQMGVLPEQAEEWLEVCQDIASPVANEVFVNSALELAQLTAKNRMDYRDVVADYKAKTDALKSLSERMSQSKNDIEKLKLEIEQATAQLDSVNKAIAEGEEALRRQKAKLKSQERAYLTERKLTKRKVKLIEAVINSGFRSSGLSNKETESLRQQIIAVGSLVRVIKQLEKHRDELKAQVDDLLVYQQHYYNKVSKLASSWEGMEIAIARKERERGELDAELKAKEQEISTRIDDLYISRLIIDFLLAPGKLTDHDFDQLVQMMIALRQKRLGIGPRQVTDANGKVVCRCQIPKISTNIEDYKVDMDQIRERFACKLRPLLRDKFVSKIEYNLSKIQNECEVKLARLQGIIEGRNR